MKTYYHPCKFGTCTFSTHYFRNRREDECDDQDDGSSFYVGFMDQTHCYLYHMYDTGMRFKRKQLMIIDEDNKDEELNEMFDEQCGKISDIIRRKLRNYKISADI